MMTEEERIAEQAIYETDWDIDGLKPCTVYALAFDPPDPTVGHQGGWDIVVYCGGLDITKALTDWQYNEIVEYIEEQRNEY